MKKKILTDFYFIYTLISVKKATPADIPLICELTMQVWPQTYTPIIGAEQVAYMLGLSYTPESLQKQMDELGHQFIISYYDGVPVAFASYGKIKEDTYKLHKIYILPAMQGKGVGRFLVGHIANELKGKGGAQLQLNVNRHNSSAISFYEKTGFKRLYDEDIDIGSGYFMNDHVLGLEL